jgi:hypothetical protein
MKHEVLNNVDHANLYINSQFKPGCGYDFNLTSVFPIEYIRLQTHYPIFFTHDKENNFYQSVAMLGFEKDENLFLESKGLITALPLSIQRIPFYIGKRTKIENGIPVDKKNLTIDVSHPSVNQEHGNRIFLEHGGNSDYLNHINRVLVTIDENINELKEFSKLLSLFDLFEPLNLSVDLGKNNENFSVKGLWTINETKLKHLEENSISELHKKGFLQHIYMIAASIPNMNNLIHLKKIKDLT